MLQHSIRKAFDPFWLVVYVLIALGVTTYWAQEVVIAAVQALPFGE